MHFERTFSKDSEHPKLPRPGILSDLCRNFTLISVWILSEALSEFCCLNFVWILLSEFCLNFVVWILLSELCCLNFVWVFVWILSEFCLIFPQFCRVLWIQTCLNFVGIFVWILSEFCLNLSEICLILSEFLAEFCLNCCLNFCLNWNKTPENVVKLKKLRIENQHFPTKFWHRSIWPMAAHKMTPGQSQTLGCNFENWSFKKRKIPKKQDWGHSGPSGFFWEDVMDLSSSFVYTDGPRSPFLKAILEKIWGIPPFSPFFLWIASSGKLAVKKPFHNDLSDPRHRNHKSLAITNHNFEVASFSRRNRNEIAVLQVFSESQWFFWVAPRLFWDYFQDIV